MNTLLPQVITLPGVVVGAVSTFGFSSLHERAKWRRNFGVRWDEKRLAAYSDYAASVKSLVSISWRVAATRGLPSTGALIQLDEGLQLMAAAESDRAAKWEGVQLLGDPRTIAAARVWHETAWELEWYASGKLDGDDEFLDTWKRCAEARQQYYNAARASLGVASGAIPVPPEQPDFIAKHGARQSISDSASHTD